MFELRGLPGRGEVLAAVAVLHGSSRADLRRAWSLAGKLADRRILVAVDGGLRTCRAEGRRPDLFVGDRDSARRVPRTIAKVFYRRGKDFSDLAGALDEVRKLRARVVTVAGLLGGRLDHEWANLFELAAHARRFAAIFAPTARGTVAITSRGLAARTPRGRRFSILAVSTRATVSLKGARYSLARRRIAQGSLGLSNVADARLDLTVHDGVVALVLPTT